MGDVIDFRTRKLIEQPKNEQEELTRLAYEIMGLSVPTMFYESSVGWVAPEKDPA